MCCLLIAERLLANPTTPVPVLELPLPTELPEGSSGKTPRSGRRDRSRIPFRRSRSRAEGMGAAVGPGAMAGAGVGEGGGRSLSRARSRSRRRSKSKSKKSKSKSPARSGGASNSQPQSPRRGSVPLALPLPPSVKDVNASLPPLRLPGPSVFSFPPRPSGRLLPDPGSGAGGVGCQCRGVISMYHVDKGRVNSVHFPSFLCGC